MHAIATNVWVRAGILLGFLFVITIFLIPSDLRSAIALKSVYILGFYSPAIVIGGIAGWLFFSVDVWWKTTLGIGLFIAILQILSALNL